MRDVVGAKPAQVLTAAEMSDQQWLQAIDHLVQTLETYEQQARSVGFHCEAAVAQHLREIFGHYSPQILAENRSLLIKVVEYVEQEWGHMGTPAVKFVHRELLQADLTWRPVPGVAHATPERKAELALVAQQAVDALRKIGLEPGEHYAGVEARAPIPSSPDNADIDLWVLGVKVPDGRKVHADANHPVRKAVREALEGLHPAAAGWIDILVEPGEHEFSFKRARLKKE